MASVSITSSVKFLAEKLNSKINKFVIKNKAFKLSDFKQLIIKLK